ncbi:hypothetical protein SAMN05421742_11319 [Roseospirillum parvum]|uniref:Uncharacterized protein n=1 Tax=Roseospirillum parvum TaxID=83401 RepID=A0A1G8FBD7_9PROT|nr:hypothetical protein SAMN05421742_11319 [Roseospirillum parvum]
MIPPGTRTVRIHVTGPRGGGQSGLKSGYAFIWARLER